MSEAGGIAALEYPSRNSRGLRDHQAQQAFDIRARAGRRSEATGGVRSRLIRQSRRIEIGWFAAYAAGNGLRLGDGSGMILCNMEGFPQATEGAQQEAQCKRSAALGCSSPIRKARQATPRRIFGLKGDSVPRTWAKWRFRPCRVLQD